MVVRQQERDVGLLAQAMRDLNRRQSQLFFLVGSFLAQFQPTELQAPIDDDVAEATAALAATLETSARGVIYEHRPASLPAERLMTALKPVVAESTRGGGTPAERDAAVVLHRIADAARDARTADAGNRRAFLDLVGRILKKPDAKEEQGAGLIV